MKNAFLITHGAAPLKPVEAVDAYLTAHALWGVPGKPSGVNLWEYLSSLVQSGKVKPSDLADMTLVECQLFNESKDGGMSLQGALRKGEILRTLPLDHYLALAKLRSGVMGS